MTVKELIEKLGAYDPDSVVRCLVVRENPFDDYEDIKDTFALITEEEKFVYITHNGKF